MHTTYSDGTESCTTVLKKCQEKNLNYISITDHNTALAYKELETLDVKSLFSGKIVPGIELNTKALNIPIEILGYGIDYQKMNELVKKVYIPAIERNKIEVKRLYNKCIQAGIILDKNCLDNYKPEMFASVFFHNEITKHEENKNILSEEAWNSSKIFYRQYMLSPEELCNKKCYKGQNFTQWYQILLKLTFQFLFLKEKDALSGAYNRHCLPANKLHFSNGPDNFLFRIAPLVKSVRY